MARLGRLAGAAGRGIGKAYYGMDHAANKASDFLVKGIVKETPAGFSNAYFGIKPSVGTNALFVAGAAAYGTYATIKGIHDNHISMGEQGYAGAPPIMAGDGIQNRSQAPSLGANGSLVFGLNSMRKG